MQFPSRFVAAADGERVPLAALGIETHILAPATTPGAAAIVPPGIPHAFRNTGTKPARLLFILAPALEAEGFFAALAASTSVGKPDSAVPAELAQRYGTKLVGPPLAD